MRDWILGLLKAASERRPGASPEELKRAEQQLHTPIPDELRELYAQSAGAELMGDVTIHPLFETGETTGLVEQSRQSLKGLPTQGVLRFGLRGGADHLFAAHKRDVNRVLGPNPPGWIHELPEDSWFYGMLNVDNNLTRLFKDLQTLFADLVPVASSEAFGENTFVRALSSVQRALEGAVGETADENAPPEKVVVDEAFEPKSENDPLPPPPVKIERGAKKKPAAKKPAAKKPAAKKPAAKAKPVAKRKRMTPVKTKSSAKPKASARKPARRSAPAKKKPAKRRR